MGDRPRDLFSLEAEQAVLGAILFDDGNLDRVADIVRADDFYDPIHRLIFESAAGLIEAGRRASPTAVDVSLQASLGYAEIGGRKYLEATVVNVPSSESAPDYARLVAELATRRALVSVAARVIERAEQSTLDDSPAAQIEAFETEVDALSERGAGAMKPKTLRKAMGDWLDAAYARGESGELPGIPCGLKTLDDALGGFRAGKLYTVGGRPGQGKTTLLNKFASGIAASGLGVALSTLEMEASDLPVMMATDRLRDRGRRLPYMQAERGNFSEDEWLEFSECARAISDLPILIDDAPAASAAHIRRFARRAARHFAAQGVKLGALIIDYLGLIERDHELMGTEAIGAITASIIRTARELRVPALMGSQLNRQSEGRDDKRPQLQDLRASGDIEQDSFAVMLLHRPAYYHSRYEPRADDPKHADWQVEMDRLNLEKPLEVIIAKNRRGPTCTVDLWCEIETAAIRSRPFDPLYPKGPPASDLGEIL